MAVMMGKRMSLVTVFNSGSAQSGEGCGARIWGTTVPISRDIQRALKGVHRAYGMSDGVSERGGGRF